MTKTRILFVCTGNSARSQMAEGFARHYGGSTFDVYSAGIEPTTIKPRAVAVMAEKGISLAGQWAKGLDEVPLQQMDLVVTLCDDAEARCPVVHGRLGRRHWSLADPGKATGSEEQIMAAFRSVRDDLDQRVQALMSELKAEPAAG
jgi:arsenate reductase